jgi:hypothetical protein
LSPSHICHLTHGKIVLDVIYRRLGGNQSQSVCCGEEKNILFLPEFEPQFPGYPVSAVIASRTALFQLPQEERAASIFKVEE